MTTQIPDPITFDALTAFPQALERHYAAFPRELVHWAPDSWEGVPSEPFTAIEQVCHVRDIEIEGYQVRIRRTLAEDSPFLPSIDSEPIAKQRNYGAADVVQVFASFRAARAETIALLRSLEAASFDRSAEFEGYGPVTLRGLVHFLCSHDQQHLSGLQWLLGKIARAA
jgi:hypothetical protein